MITNEFDKILYLTTSKKNYDAINLGIKKEHYLEIKDYWVLRLIKQMSNYTLNRDFEWLGLEIFWEKYSFIEFRHEYTTPANVIKIELKQIYLGMPLPEWNDKKYKDCFILLLGKKVSHSLI